MFDPSSRRHYRASLAVALLLAGAWLFTWIGAAAQTFPLLNGVVSDDTGKVDAASVNSAVKQLQGMGVKPIVVLSQSGDGSSTSDAFARAAATQYNLATGQQQLDPNLFAIVVVLDSRQATILSGDGIANILGGATSDRIRAKYLNPSLAAGDYTRAFVDSLTEAARTVDQVRNPAPTATPVPAVVTQVDTGGLGAACLLGLGVLVVLGALAFFGPMFWRQRQKSREAAARISALRSQLMQARNVTADMITNLDLPADPREQIQYRFLALALAQERPEQLAQITGQYNDTYKRVAQALTVYNDLNQRTFTTEQELTWATTQYQQVQADVNAAQGFLQQLAGVSRQVEGQTTAAPGEVDAAKKAIAAATDELGRLAAAAPDLYVPKADDALKPATARLSQAQSAMQAKPAMLLRAYDDAAAAHSMAESALQSVRSLSQAYATLAQQREKLSSARKQGFKLPHADKTFSDALDALSAASRRLEADDTAAFGGALKAASDAIQAAGASVDAELSLHAANDKALAEMKAAGEELKSYIQQGAQAFDRVDDYAESAWRDIRGNGTEAQKAADRAFALWQEASALNSLASDSPQDFDKAAGLLKEGSQAVASSRQLIAAILDRLKNLQESQRTAQQEMEAAERDVQVGKSYISKYDPDISPKPADLLGMAEKLVAQARAEAALPKPDWIKVVSTARQANDMADRALADARSQEEAMQALRLKVQTTSQQASASFSRASNFVSVHQADLDSSVAKSMSQARAKMQNAQQLAAQAEKAGIEDVARGQALERAANAFAEAQQSADEVYNSALEQFQKIDALRARASTAIQKAEATINLAANYIRENRSTVSEQAIMLVNSAARMLPQRRDGATADDLANIASTADTAEQRAAQAYHLAQQEVQQAEQLEEQRAGQSQNDIGSSIALGVLGALLSSGGGGGGGHRSSGGWGGGSSGGWGSGSSSSGGWGGGSSSSGSFGGGSSSGGSWGGGSSSSGGW